MTIIRVLTAVAVSALLSTSAMAFGNSTKVGSAGSSSAGAFVQGKDAKGFAAYNVDTKTSLNNGQTSTDASGIAAGSAKFGTVIVGGQASAASGGKSGH